MGPPGDLLTVDDYECVARARLTPMAYDYYRSGADEEQTLRRNRDAFAAYEIWYRVLVDGRLAAPETATTVLGDQVSTPVLIAPTAFHRMADAEGEKATARAAHELGTLFCVSTLATTSLEDVASAAPGGLRWYQLYVHKDRQFTGRLIERAKAAGYRAIAVTVDTPVLGRRVADARNGFRLPDELSMANLEDIIPPSLRRGAGSELARFVAECHDPSFAFRDLQKIAEQAAPLPVVVKGICRGDDALRALDHGAKAIWVSNHGGRQLDYAPATVDSLREVVRAVGDRAEVFHDGGIRSGTHALIALALGARAVFVGRPVLWGLAARGERGVVEVLGLLHSELVRSMTLAGCPSLRELDADLVRRR